MPTFRSASKTRRTVARDVSDSHASHSTGLFLSWRCLWILRPIRRKNLSSSGDIGQGEFFSRDFMTLTVGAAWIQLRSYMSLFYEAHM
jgi:hypothetical protein